MANPESIYDALKAKKTAQGVSFLSCIKPAMDFPGDVKASLKASGVVAGDEAAFTDFKALFDPLLRQELFEAGGADKAPQLSTHDVDPYGKYVHMSTVQVFR